MTKSQMKRIFERAIGRVDHPSDPAGRATCCLIEEMQVGCALRDDWSPLTTAYRKTLGPCPDDYLRAAEAEECISGGFWGDVYTPGRTPRRLDAESLNFRLTLLAMAWSLADAGDLTVEKA